MREVVNVFLFKKIFFDLLGEATLLYGMFYHQSKNYYFAVLVYETCCVVTNHEHNWRIYEFVPSTIKNKMFSQDDINADLIEEYTRQASFSIDELSITYNEKFQRKKIKDFEQFFGHNFDVHSLCNIVMDQTVEDIKINYYKPLLAERMESMLQSFDADLNYQIDTFEGQHELKNLLVSKQKLLLDRQKEYNSNFLKDLVKLSEHINQKIQFANLFIQEAHQKAPQGIYNDQQHILYQVQSYQSLIEQEIEAIESMIVAGISMVSALIDDDQLHFYEVYEKLDNLNIWSSNLDREVLSSLGTISNNLERVSNQIEILSTNLVREIRSSSLKIVESINMQSLIQTEHAESMDRHLSSIGSSMKTANALNGIGVLQRNRMINGK